MALATLQAWGTGAEAGWELRFLRFFLLRILVKSLSLESGLPSASRDRPRDCMGCRIVGAAGLIGIGAYLANVAWKNKTFVGRITFSTISLAFVTLGVQRYKQEFPFEKRTEKS
ncbi:unnamed protein product, partial [Iphiclides podalirius]